MIDTVKPTPTVVKVYDAQVPFSTLHLDERLHAHEIDQERLGHFIEELGKPKSWVSQYRVEVVKHTDGRLVVIDGRLVTLAYHARGRAAQIPVRIYEGLPHEAWLLWRFRGCRNPATRTRTIVEQLKAAWRWFAGWRRSVIGPDRPRPG